MTTTNISTERVRRMTVAMREADKHFEKVGGSTRHYVRDCLLPILEKHGLELVVRVNDIQTSEGSL